MKTVSRLLSIATVTLFLASCKKEGQTPSVPAAVNFQLKATSTTSALSKVAAGSIQWISGTATPASVKFEAKKGTSEIEFSSSANQQVNLFNVTQSNFGNITLPDGTYNEIELKFALNGTIAAPALELNGSYNNGSTTIPVSFRLTTAVLLKAEKNNVAVNGGAFTAITDLPLSSYTTGITQAMLNSATQTNGTIIISSASNPNLYNTIITNIGRFHHAEFHHH